MIDETPEEEIKRLKIAIGTAAAELEHQLDTTRLLREGDGNNAMRYALRSLRECVAPPVFDEEQEYMRKPAKEMTNEELVDRFASLYEIHSNPMIYNYLKSGHDEIIKRLTTGKAKNEQT